MDKGVVADRPGVGGPVPKRLAIDLARCGNVAVGHGREGQHLDGVDLDDDTGSAVAAALLDLRPAPEPDRDSDLAAGNPIAKVAADIMPTR